MPMQRKRVSPRQIQAEIKKLSRAVLLAFLRSVDKRLQGITLTEVEALIDKQDALFELLKFKESDLAEIFEEIRKAQQTGGKMQAEAVGAGFSSTATKTAAWMVTKSSDFVTDINESVRNNLREILAVNNTLGIGIRQTALDIVGRVGLNGKRTGGILGMNQPQAKAAASARANLESGEKDAMRAYLGNELRDRRFDGIVKKAIAEGKKLPVNIIGQIITNYQNRLMRWRGEMIARTETMEAVHAGQAQAMAQQVDNGTLDGWRVVKIWMTTDDKRTRHDHWLMDGKEVGEKDFFVLPDGSLMQYPGDSSHGARAGQVINCRCTVAYKMVKKDD